MVMIRKRYIVFLLVLMAIGIGWFLVPSGYRNLTLFIMQNDGVKQNLLEVGNFDIAKNGNTITVPFKNQYQIPILVKYEFDETNDNFRDIANYTISDKKCPEFKIDMTIRIEILVGDKVCSDMIVSSPLDVYPAWRSGPNPILFLWLGEIDYPLKAYLSSDKKMRITIEKTDSILQGCKGRFIFTPYYPQ